MLVVLVTHAVVCAHGHTINVSSAFLVEGDWVRAHDDGGDYVWVPDDACASEGGWCHGNTRPEAGSLNFNMRCDGAADVKFEALVLTPDGDADSIFIKVDGVGVPAWATTVMDSAYWHLGAKTSWSWAANSPEVAIASGGAYRVVLLSREDGCRLSALRISAGADTCRWAPWTGAVIGQLATTSCPQGSSAITTESECEDAASALGKTYDKPDGFGEGPVGCVDESDGLKRGMAFNTHATTSEHMDQSPVCLARFAIGHLGTTSCPYGTSAITTSTECEDAASALGKTYDKPDGFGEGPVGCVDESDGLKRGMAFNTHAPPSVHMDQSPVCFPDGTPGSTTPATTTTTSASFPSSSSTTGAQTTSLSTTRSSTSTPSPTTQGLTSTTITTTAPRSATSVTTTALAVTSAITTTNVTISPPVLTTPTPMFVSCGIKCRMQIVEWKCNTSCGDGFRAGFEECDDGNVVDSDGCRCEIEFGVESAHCLAM